MYRPTLRLTTRYFPHIVRKHLFNTACLLFLLLTIQLAGSAQTQPPPAPTVTATAGVAQITVSWNAVPDAISYAAYYSTVSASGPFSFLSNYQTTSFTATNVQNGTTYYFYVQAVNSNQQASPNSNVASAMPWLDAPSPSARPGNARVTLSWSAVSGATSYLIYCANDDSNINNYFLCAPEQSTTSLTVNASNGITSYFKVKAVNGAGPSPFSATAVAYVDLEAPTGVRAVKSTNGTQATVSWGSVADATKYGLYTALDPSSYGNFTIFAEITRLC